jgi:hypothetical protein
METNEAVRILLSLVVGGETLVMVDEFLEAVPVAALLGLTLGTITAAPFAVFALVVHRKRRNMSVGADKMVRGLYRGTSQVGPR